MCVFTASLSSSMLLLSLDMREFACTEEVHAAQSKPFLGDIGPQ